MAGDWPTSKSDHRGVSSEARFAMVHFSSLERWEWIRLVASRLALVPSVMLLLLASYRVAK